MNGSNATAYLALQQRWDRLGLGVRCALNPQRQVVLLLYVQAGRRLSELRPEREPAIQRRMLDLLLHTAADEALPWSWRAVCLDHTAWPLARLTSLLRRQAGEHQDCARNDSAQLALRVQHAAERLGLPKADASFANPAQLP